jgi:tetratricopeptide (TPR) repeat protein
VYVRSKELPEGCRFTQGMPCASFHASSYYEHPSFKELMRGIELPAEMAAEVEAMFPVPKKKEWQSFEADGGVPGSVLMFEFEPADIPKARDFFPFYLYGAGGPSGEHPEEVIYTERLVMVISFPRGDPAAEWFKDRLRKKLGIPAPREHLELRELGVKIVAALNANEVEAGLALFKENADKVRNWAFGQFLLGAFRFASDDAAGAEQAYRRALELHDTLEDPLGEGMVWGTLDMLGSVLLKEGKAEAAVPVLQRAEECGARLATENAPRSSYNLACAYARLQRWEDSLQALKRAIEAEPKYKAKASADEELAEARKRKEFEDLLR